MRYIPRSGAGAGAAIALVGALVWGLGGGNWWLNTKTRTTDAYRQISTSTLPLGHTDYLEFPDCTSNIKVYPRPGHRLWESELFEELDGDDRVDRIRRNGGELAMNSLREILVRTQDFAGNESRFAAADEKLRELRAEHGRAYPHCQ